MCLPSRSTRCTRWPTISSHEPDAGVQPGVDVLADAGVPDVAGADDPSLQFDGPVIDDAPVIDAHETPLEDDWSHSVPEDHHLEPDNSGFDIFD